MSPPPTRDSAISPCFHGCLTFLHRHFPGSPPLHPLNPSLQSQRQPSPCDCSTIPNSSSQALPLPGDQHSCLVCVWLCKDCLILIPFKLPQISCFILSLKCFSSNLPCCDDQTPASVPPPSEGRSSPTNTPVFPPSSFVLSSFASLYIFFSSGQALLSTLSWHSACTSVSEGVFLMYLWREMYSTSTYSSVILFSFIFPFVLSSFTGS